MISWPEQGQN